MEFTQPDGTKLLLKVFGDEFYARTETLDGYTVVFDPATKTYFYANLSTDHKHLEPTKLKAGIDNPASISLPKHIQLDRAVVSEQARAAQERWQSDTGIEQRWKDLKESRQKAETANSAVAEPSRTSGGPAPAPDARDHETERQEPDKE